MLTEQQQSALRGAVAAARASGHVQPEMAAVEAMVESAWGTSDLAIRAHNLFGTKQQQHPVYGTVHLPTREYLHGAWVTEDAAWADYPDYNTCFLERMKTLVRLESSFPAYAAALAAATPEVYVTEVSRTWSTDPNRAQTCIAIYHAHRDLLGTGLLPTGSARTYPQLPA